LAKNQYTQRKPLYFENTGSATQVRQKLSMILENKVVQKLKLEKKNVFYKKWSPRLTFLNEFFFFEKISSIFDKEN